MYKTNCKFNSTIDTNPLFTKLGTLSNCEVPNKGSSRDMLKLISLVKPQAPKVYNVYSFGPNGKMFLVHEDNPKVEEAIIYTDIHID